MSDDLRLPTIPGVASSPDVASSRRDFIKIVGAGGGLTLGVLLDTGRAFAEIAPGSGKAPAPVPSDAPRPDAFVRVASDNNVTVAIIGTGRMGSGLAKLLASKGVEVAIGHRDPAKAIKLAREIGGKAQGGGVAAAAKLADIVILAVWYQQMADAIRAAGDLSGKIVVDISNPVTKDFKGLSIGFDTSAAEEIQKLAPQAKVVKAYNTVFADLLPAEAREGRAAPVQVFVAGDDAAAKRAVFDIVAKGGFVPVESGPLSNARFLEPVGGMNIWFGVHLGQGTSTAPAWVKA